MCGRNCENNFIGFICKLSILINCENVALRVNLSASFYFSVFNVLSVSQVDCLTTCSRSHCCRKSYGSKF